MTAPSTAEGAVETALLVAAQGGDEAAFRRLTEGHVRELHVHCYRMLGSVQDAEDAVQETLLRAWRHLSGFERRSSFRSWLYRIATNVAWSSGRRRQAIEISPYPDAYLEELENASEGPAARYDRRESVQLAFVAAMQLLPPRQRAALLLHDVLGWKAVEVAGLLDTTPSSVHSALHRARATLERGREQANLRLDRTAVSSQRERELAGRFLAAWDAVDVAGLVALLREDAVLTMPPFPLRYEGREAIAEFFSTVPAGGALDQIRLVSTRANRQPALAAYQLDPGTGTYQAYGIMVLTLGADAIAEITGFADSMLFRFFDLPPELPPELAAPGA
ncbi:MAG: RNA polymerase subunit sigma-70 [Candidatus Dormibacteraeota bacterium]|nr:RNA polymerase subunit sigma-70 [Candidatus Dormibacteraeota bacterium]MBO0761067.1 RNA polymerase subunit sigma-70 [Candidatus Dormibacteraeota bacterium]